MRILVHLATGPENPTRVALGLLVARTALAAGHDVDVFIAGDGVDVLRDETRGALNGIGTGSASEHWQALRDGGARLFASGMSSKARGITESDGVQLAPPDVLVQLITEADRVVSY
jgi:predicted peroxiredoxin